MNKNEGPFLPGLEPEADKNYTDDKTKEQIPKLVYATEEERISCQYCEDVGPCRSCSRGQLEMSRLKKMKK